MKLGSLACLYALWFLAGGQNLGGSYPKSIFIGVPTTHATA